MLNKSFLGVIAVLAVLVLLTMMFSGIDRTTPIPEPRIPYSEFKTLLVERVVEHVTVRDDTITGVLIRPRALSGAAEPVRRFTTVVPKFGDPKLLELFEQSGTVYRFIAEAEQERFSWLGSILPWLVLLGVYLWFSRKMFQNAAGGFGPKGGIAKLLEGRTRTTEPSEGPKVTFDDVAGQDAAKHEVAEIVDFLRDPGRFTALGAEPPRGILLMGAPGTGKTLLARALAGEAGVPFLSISASEFIEVFVGVGAARVRNMFDEAKKRAPSIIFIDELDSIGRVRGTGVGGGHDEREQTLNQILAEMDGFSGHEAVIILAATNRPDVLDPALLRPGRFDRHVTLSLPDRAARIKILEVHVRNKPLAEDVDLAVIAAGTPGFSGADLKNLANEAALLAASEDAEAVAMHHFDEGRDKVIMGVPRGIVLSEDEHHRLAVHEAGHTLVACHLPNADPIYKVTVIPRGRALGATQQLPETDRQTLPEDYLRDRLAVLLAGRAAERKIIGTISSGADDDIRQATALARSMVDRWGMSEDVGPIDVRESDEHPFLGREISQPRRFSEATADIVDRAVAALLKDADARAADIIAALRADIDRLIAALEARETLERGEIEAIVGESRGLARRSAGQRP